MVCKARFYRGPFPVLHDASCGPIRIWGGEGQNGLSVLALVYGPARMGEVRVAAWWEG